MWEPPPPLSRCVDPQQRVCANNKSDMHNNTAQLQAKHDPLPTQGSNQRHTLVLSKLSPFMFTSP